VFKQKLGDELALKALAIGGNGWRDEQMDLEYFIRQGKLGDEAGSIQNIKQKIIILDC